MRNRAEAMTVASAVTKMASTAMPGPTSSAAEPFDISSRRNTVEKNTAIWNTYHMGAILARYGAALKPHSEAGRHYV